MIIEFASDNLQYMLRDPASIKRHYPQIAKQIINRLSELQAAKHLNDLPPVPPPKLRKAPGESNCWLVSIGDKYSLLMEVEEHSPAKTDYALNLTEKIKILAITEER